MSHSKIPLNRKTPRLQPAIRCKDAAVILDRTRIMGIVNVTPDSFSDGGKFFSPKKAIAQALSMAELGADILDIGGESTRPGSLPVPVQEELKRVIPVIRAVARMTRVPISIDTTKASVADEALQSGAQIINDTSGLADDPAMVSVAARHNCPVLIMHRKGAPRIMQRNPHYDDAVAEIKNYFKKRISYLVKCGIKVDKIIIDPGICFGKTLSHNLQIINNLGCLCSLGRPVAIGVSRKSFIGMLMDGAPPEKRLAGSLAAAACAVMRGARIVRAHDVEETAAFFRIYDAIERSS